MSDPPEGFVQPLSAAGRARLAEIFGQYRHTNILLRDETHEMICLLTSPEGELQGMSGWAKRSDHEAEV